MNDPEVGNVPPPPPVATASVVTGRRIVAGLIDMVPLIFLAIAMGDRSTGSGQFNVNLEGVRVLWWLVASIAYYAVAELATNTSPGKAVMGLCVRDDRTKLPAKRQILIRSAMRIIDILPVMYLLGLIVTASSAHRKRLGDMAAGTLVLQRSEVGEPDLGAKNLAALVAVVLITVGAGVALLVASDARERVGEFDVDEQVVPYVEEIIAGAFRPPSAEALRVYVVPGLVSDADIETFVNTMNELAGGVTDDYEIDDRRFNEFTIDGKSVEAVSLRILAEFEKRPGQLVLTLADVDGELRLIGFNFNV